MKVASARLSLQAMRFSYFKNSDFTPSLQRIITLRVSKLLLMKVSMLCVRCAISDMCTNVCVRASMKAASAYFGLATNSGRVADL